MYEPEEFPTPFRLLPTSVENSALDDCVADLVTLVAVFPREGIACFPRFLGGARWGGVDVRFALFFGREEGDGGGDGGVEVHSVVWDVAFSQRVGGESRCSHSCFLSLSFFYMYILFGGGGVFWEERVCVILFEMFYSEGTVYWYGGLIIGGGTQCATRSLLLLERERAKTRAGLEAGGEERKVQEVAYIIIISQAIANGSDTSQGSGCCMIDIT